jgi:hypothetical protein
MQEMKYSKLAKLFSFTIKEMALDVHIPQTHILSKYHNNFGMI